MGGWDSGANLCTSGLATYNIQGTGLKEKIPLLGGSSHSFLQNHPNHSVTSSPIHIVSDYYYFFGFVSF